MSEKRETLFRKKVVRDLKVIPDTVVLSVQQVAINGTPDLLICMQGRFVALELKANARARRSPLQAYNIDRINKVGGRAYFAYPENWTEVYAELKTLSEAQ